MYLIRPKYLKGRHEFVSPLAAGSVNGSLTIPSGSSLTVVDTETCLSIIPNLSSVIDDHTGVTFGGSNNRCSYALNYSWACYTGFDFAPFANSGYVLLLKDGNGWYCWGYIGEAGEGEMLGSELVDGWANNATHPYETFTAGAGSDITQAVNSAGYAFANKVITAINGALYKSEAAVTLNSGTAPQFRFASGDTGSAPTLAIGSNSFSNIYKVAAAVYTRIQFYHGDGVATDFALSGFTTKQVTAPPATAVKIYRDAARTINGWNKPTAFDMNGAAYTFGIHEALSGGKMFFMGGEGYGCFR